MEYDLPASGDLGPVQSVVANVIVHTVTAEETLGLHYDYASTPDDRAPKTDDVKTLYIFHTARLRLCGGPVPRWSARPGGF
jgi:hypothetical protein